MNDFISKQTVCEALDDLAEYFDNQVHEPIMSNGVMNARSRIMDISIIDAVQVVHCKDCKFYECEKCCINVPFCTYERDKTDFCSRGKRKDDNT